MRAYDCVKAKPRKGGINPEGRSHTLMKRHLSEVVDANDKYDFLVDLLPRQMVDDVVPRCQMQVADGWLNCASEGAKHEPRTADAGKGAAAALKAPKARRRPDPRPAPRPGSGAAPAAEAAASRGAGGSGTKRRAPSDGSADEVGQPRRGKRPRAPAERTCPTCREVPERPNALFCDMCGAKL